MDKMPDTTDTNTNVITLTKEDLGKRPDLASLAIKMGELESIAGAGSRRLEIPPVAPPYLGIADGEWYEKHPWDYTKSDVQTMLHCFNSDTADYDAKEASMIRRGFPIESLERLRFQVLRFGLETIQEIIKVPKAKATLSIIKHANAMEALRRARILFRYDEFTGGKYIKISRYSKAQVIIPDKWSQFTDKEAVIVGHKIKMLCPVGLEPIDIREAIDCAFIENTVHSLKEYFKTLTWDGVERLPNLFETYYGAKDEYEEWSPLMGRYLAEVSLTTFIGAVRRIVKPGSKHDTVPVLEGRERIGKSKSIEVLCADPDWFTDQLKMNISQKELVEHTQGKWLVELSELAGRSRADMEAVKAFISGHTDTVRMAYTREAKTYLRQFVMWGTTNKTNYLVDITGNRRFLPVKVGEIDLDSLERDRDQLWAEAVSREARGEKNWMTNLDVLSVAMDEQAERLEQDPYSEMIEGAIGEQLGYIRLSDVMLICGVQDLSNTGTNKRLANELRKLGFEQKILRRNGTKSRYYVRAMMPKDRKTCGQGKLDLAYTKAMSHAINTPIVLGGQREDLLPKEARHI